MADLEITTNDVLAAEDCKFVIAIAGQTLAAGQPLYRNPVDGRYYKSISSDLTASRCDAIAVSQGIAGRPFVVIITAAGGNIVIGAGSLSAAKPYCVSNTAGMIRPIDDVGSGEYLTIIGYATTSLNLRISVTYMGLQTAAAIS